MKAWALIILSLFMAVPLHAEQLVSDCTIIFHATSPLPDFDGEGDCDPFVVTIRELEQGKRQVEPWAIRIPLSTLRTGLAPRDSQMQQMFESEVYPTILGEMGSFDPDQWLAAVHAGNGPVVYPFPLTMHGLTRNVEAEVDRFFAEDGRIELDFSFDILLTDYGMKLPRLFGMRMVDDLVNIEVLVKMKKEISEE